ncbi:class 1 fructose-bisphosphatase [Primorskyibacter sp. 2E107]|uniref:class 1 fructose-bisphosphatase n=1 Tax=Primorskyibacter sp. 2E107 TaxID=3403458 RepID=UPI003AF8748E
MPHVMTSDVMPLTLDRDAPIAAPTLPEYLHGWAGADEARQALATLILALADEAVPLALRLAQGMLPGDPTHIVGENDSGDRQKALDVAAHDHMIDAMRGLRVAKVLSEEAEEVETLDPKGIFDVAMDPIDGSGSIGIGAPLGALFAIFPAGESFLRTGREMIAACYVSFGHSVDFGFSTGAGVVLATFDPVRGEFFVDETGVTVKPKTTTVAFNVSYYRRWSDGLQSYVRDVLDGASGPRGMDFNMRWIAAAVGDLHRILRRGGLFMYPGDTRPGYEDGYLRLAYEAFPIAYLMEQAGGAATDGVTPILDLAPAHLHDRVPLVFGSVDEVNTVKTYLTEQKD